MAGYGWVWFGKAGEAGRGQAGHGTGRYGRLGQVR